MLFGARGVRVTRVLVAWVVAGVCIAGCGADRETRLASHFVGALNAHDYQSACAVLEPVPRQVLGGPRCARALSERLGCRRYSLGDPHKVQGPLAGANTKSQTSPTEIFDLAPVAITGVDVLVLLDGGAGHLVLFDNSGFFRTKHQEERLLGFFPVSPRTHRRQVPCP